MRYKVDSTETNGRKHSDQLRVALEQSEVLNVRSGAVVSYGGNISMSESTSESILKKVTSQKKYPITKVTGNEGGGVVTVAPPVSGAIQPVKIEPDRELKVQTLSYLCSEQNFSKNLDKSEIYDSDELATLTVVQDTEEGSDNIYIAGSGGMSLIELSDDQATHIRQDYVGAMDGSVSFKTENVSTGIADSILKAEPFSYLRIAGPGRVYVHARSPFTQSRVYTGLSDTYPT